MPIAEKINEEIKKALKSGDKGRLRAIRAIKAAFLLAQKEGGNTEIDDTRAIQIIQKLIKQRKESLEIYEKSGREDLAQREREELKVLQAYLPQQLSEEEIHHHAQRVVEQLGATSIKDMGKVMGRLTKELAGRADNAVVAKIVKQLLGGV